MAIIKEINRPYLVDEVKNPHPLQNVLNYVLNQNHAIDGYAFGGAVALPHAHEQMMCLKQCYGKTDGKQLRHFVLSFQAKDKITEKDIVAICYYIACFCGEEYQTVSAVHTNTGHPHIHFVLNSVGYRMGLMFPGSFSFMHSLKLFINKYYPDLEIELVADF